jgi:hypothetical protein
MRLAAAPPPFVMLYFKLRVSSSSHEALDTPCMLHAVVDLHDVEAAAKEIVHFMQTEDWSLGEALEARRLQPEELISGEPFLRQLWDRAEQNGLVILIEAEQVRTYTKVG